VYLLLVLCVLPRPLPDAAHELCLGGILETPLLEFIFQVPQVLQFGLHQHDLAAGVVQLIPHCVVLFVGGDGLN
jgi:hypothetical protein